MSDKQPTTTATKTEKKPPAPKPPTREDLVDGVREALASTNGDSDFEVCEEGTSELGRAMFRLGRVHGILSGLAKREEAAEDAAASK